MPYGIIVLDRFFSNLLGQIKENTLLGIFDILALPCRALGEHYLFHRPGRAGCDISVFKKGQAALCGRILLPPYAK